MFVRPFVAALLFAFSGCASGELAPLPATHPASAQAEEAPLTASSQPVPSSVTFAHGSAPSDTPAAATQAYVCPMHAEVTSQAPGECPKCGMKLVPVKKP